MAWQHNKRITGVWTNYQNVNAWAYVSGLGWRKLTNPDDDVTNAMLTICTNAKAHGWSVDFYEYGSGGNILIKEIYAW